MCMIGQTVLCIAGRFNGSDSDLRSAERIPGEITTAEETPSGRKMLKLVKIKDKVIGTLLPPEKAVKLRKGILSDWYLLNVTTVVFIMFWQNLLII